MAFVRKYDMRNNFDYLVIVCAYNEEENILRCLESIENSIINAGKSERFHMVSVDNSSSDNTGRIAKEFCTHKKNFSYLRIRHCNLSVSRNSYKLFPSAKYVAYVDADGFVDRNWASELDKIIQTTDPDIISGPVHEASMKTKNGYWELFYDSSLTKTGKYLIGANMVFRKTLLDTVQGFPTFFKTRGDESSLLLKIGLLEENVSHVFSHKLIAHNNFCDDSIAFIKSQYSDGKRSYVISKLRDDGHRHLVNCCNRFASILLLALGFVWLFVNPLIGGSIVFLSYLTHLLRFRFFHCSIAKRIFCNFRIRKLFTGLTIVISKYLFDIGFVNQLLFYKKLPKDTVYETARPCVLESINVR